MDSVLLDYEAESKVEVRELRLRAAFAFSLH
jgi:hypothetical protein